MKEVIGFLAFCAVCGYLFDRAKPATKAKIVGGVALGGYGMYKLVEWANKPSEDAAYAGVDDDPRYW